MQPIVYVCYMCAIDAIRITKLIIKFAICFSMLLYAVICCYILGDFAIDAFLLYVN